VNLLNVPAKISMLEEAVKKLGTTLRNADPGLLSVLIGAPLVASAQVHKQEESRVRGHAMKQKRDRLASILHRDD
jgi:hypothetical protein